MASLPIRSDPDHRWLLRIGGASLLAVAALFVLLIALGVLLLESAPYLLPGPPISGPDLAALAGNASLARLNFGLGMLSDLLFIPATLALYVSLRKVDRDAMVVAVAFLFLYIILDLVVTGLNYATLVAISQGYAANSTGSQASYVAVANYIKELTALSLPISSGVLSVGILVIGWVMLKGVFTRRVAYTGMAAGIVGLVYGASVLLPGLAALQVLSAAFETVWFIFVGVRLVLLATPAPSSPDGLAQGA